jgi:hypothetical protein
MEATAEVPEQQNRHEANPVTEYAPTGEQAENEQEYQRPSKSRFLLGIVIGIVGTCLIGVLYYLFKPEQEQLYLTGVMNSNSDYSYYVGISTDDFQNFFPDEGGSGDGPCCGDYQIVVTKQDDESRQLTSILKSSQIGYKHILKVYPSSKYPTVVYFNCIEVLEGYFNDFNGKIDIETHEYTTFDGDIYGMIEYGTYKDCYLVQREDLLYIFRQSPVGESATSVVSFNPKQYFGDANPSASDIISWLEKQ